MAVADNKSLVSEIMNLVDDHVTAKASRQLEQQIMNLLDGYQVATIFHDSSNGADNSQELINAFINHKIAEGMAKSTIYLYRYRLERFHEDLGVPVKKINSSHITDYLASELERGLSKSTLNGFERTILQFFRWMYEEELIQKNPAKNIKPVRFLYEQKEAFSQREIQLIKEACTTDKQRAMIHFLLTTGCRKAEFISVNTEDLDFKNLQLQVVGKGSKTRTVYFDDVTAMMLKRYLVKRKDQNPALFVDRNGNRYKSNTITRMMERMSEKTNIHIYAHRFRHTLAQTLLDRGMRIEEVQQILGHEKIETTRRYCHASQRNAENSYRKYACM